MAQQIKEAKMELTKEEFGPFWQFLEQDTITDIDYQGSSLWITDLKAGVYEVTDETILNDFTKEFIDLFTRMISNHVNKAFNRGAGNNVLEAETESLRIEIMHESVANSGRSICIRKSPPKVRNTIESSITSKYIDPDALSFLINCVRSRFSMAFCGEPGVGKTELLKFLSQYIAKNQKVITIEDNPEIHYGDINPGALYQELKIDGERFSYTTAIKSCLRLNPKWIVLSEARSREVKYLLEAWSTGVSGMTTLHTDDVRKIPERIKNMMGSDLDSDRMDNSIYESLKVGALLRQKYDPDRRQNYRYVDQIGLFYREDGENRMVFIVKDGELVSKNIPKSIVRMMERYDVEDPFKNELVEEAKQNIELEQREEAEADRQVEESTYLDAEDPEAEEYDENFSEIDNTDMADVIDTQNNEENPDVRSGDITDEDIAIIEDLDYDESDERGKIDEPVEEATLELDEKADDLAEEVKNAEDDASIAFEDIPGEEENETSTIDETSIESDKNEELTEKEENNALDASEKQEDKTMEEPSEYIRNSKKKRRFHKNKRR